MSRNYMSAGRVDMKYKGQLNCQGKKEYKGVDKYGGKVHKNSTGSQSGPKTKG